MGYIKYGEVFKKLRLQSGYSLNELASVGISKSSLSRFEHGQSMLSLEVLWALLSFMGISLQDFEYYLNDYEDSESDWLIDQVLKATLYQDREGLYDLRRLAKVQNHPHIALAAKASFSALSPVEQDYLSKHFRNIRLWNRKELCVFFLIMNELNSQDIWDILNSFLNRYVVLLNSERYKYYLAQVFCRGVTLFSYREEKEMAKKLLDCIFSHHLSHSMYVNNLVKLCQGYWIYCFEDTIYGDKLMQRSLTIFKTLATPKVVQYYEERYRRFVLRKQREGRREKNE